MDGIRQESRHHSDEQIREAIECGERVVDELQLPNDLRVKAFELAVNTRAAKSITVEQVRPGSAGVALPRVAL